MTIQISSFLSPSDVFLDIRAPDKISLLHEILRDVHRLPSG